MRKTFLCIAVSAALSIGYSVPLTVSAQGTTSSTINAEILPSIWYSDLSAEADKVIDVHAGIQNNSGIDFSGTAMLYVDDVLAGQKTFSSKTDSLEDVFIPWKATVGKHVFQMKATATLPSGKTLISYKSDLSYMSISSVVTFSSVKDGIVAGAVSVASGAIERADDVAAALIKDLESAKQQTENGKAPTGTAHGTNPVKSGSSAGTSSGFSLLSNNQMAAVFNTGIDVLAFLVQQWKWTLSVVALVALFIFFKKKFQ